MQQVSSQSRCFGILHGCSMPVSLAVRRQTVCSSWVFDNACSAQLLCFMHLEKTPPKRHLTGNTCSAMTVPKVPQQVNGKRMLLGGCIAKLKVLKLPDGLASTIAGDCMQPARRL